MLVYRDHLHTSHEVHHHVHIRTRESAVLLNTLVTWDNIQPCLHFLSIHTCHLFVCTVVLTISQKHDKHHLHDSKRMIVWDMFILRSSFVPPPPSGQKIHYSRFNRIVLLKLDERNDWIRKHWHIYFYRTHSGGPDGPALLKCPSESWQCDQHERYREPETESAKWNSAIITFITALFICFKWEGPVSLQVVRHDEQLWQSQKEILE